MKSLYPTSCPKTLWETGLKILFPNYIFQSLSYFQATVLHEASIIYMSQRKAFGAVLHNHTAQSPAQNIMYLSEEDSTLDENHSHVPFSHK